MAWTAPRTWTTGELVTAAIMNTHVRNNLSFLHDAPKVKMGRSTSLSIANDTVTAVAFTSARTFYNADGMWSGTNSTRLTAVRAGVYRVTAGVVWNANSTGFRLLSIRKNGANDFGLVRDDAAVNEHGQTVSVDLSLAVNDYVEMMLRQNSGGSLAIQANTDLSPTCSAHWMST